MGVLLRNPLATTSDQRAIGLASHPPPMLLQRRGAPMTRTKSKAKKGKEKRRRLRRLLFRLSYWPLRVFAHALAAAILLVGSCTVVDPPGGYYLAAEWVRLGHIDREWRDLEDISPDLARAVMAAEDARFCDHWGFDIEAIEQAIEANAKGRRVRGASTLSQQVAKNLFLWPWPLVAAQGAGGGFHGADRDHLDQAPHRRGLPQHRRVRRRCARGAGRRPAPLQPRRRGPDPRPGHPPRRHPARPEGPEPPRWYPPS